MHKLLIEDDEGKTVAVPLIREEITIGRMEGNTIRLTEQNVSRKHARLTLRAGVLRIEDLGSYNGTSLNGSSLSGVATLKDGDVILIGDYRLGIQEDRQNQVAQAANAEPSSAAMATPPVEESMEGQPTIPISTLAVQTAFSEPPARLVVTGRFQSGAEFILDRPSQVIGRTPENDIVLNHKSISRHHAKILRDGNRYTMLDLESANGVRIGGTQHDKVELQSGDTIELGEVRLRFLAGDADLYDQPRAWYRDKRKLGLVGGLGATAITLIILLVAAPSRDKPVAVVEAPPVAPPAPPPVAVQPAVPSPPPAAPTVQPAQPSAAQAPVPAEPTVPLAELLAQAKASAKQEKWQDALALVDKAATQAPGSAEVAELRKAIAAEQKNGEKIASLQTALASKELDSVIEGAGEIPDESMYKPRARELLKSAQAQALTLHLENAKAKYAANQCDEAKHEAQAVLAIDATNKRAAGIIKHCDAVANQPAAPVVAAAPQAKPAPHRPAPVAAPAPRPVAPSHAQAAAKVESAAPPVDADKLIKEAQQAWFRGQYAVAVDSARRALRAKPSLTNAYQIIAVCSCALHDAESAARAVEKLDERNRQYVKTACQKNGISF